MNKQDVLSLIDRVGSNAYNVIVNEDGASALVEMTAAQASKISELLGEDNVQFVTLKASHVVVRVTLEALVTAAAERKRTRASSVNVTINSRVQYDVVAPDAANDVTHAWWASHEMSGGITVNDTEYEILPGLAGDYYDEPEDSEKAKEWNPERSVYVVHLPTNEGELILTSYGVTNLIRRTCARQETIG